VSDRRPVTEGEAARPAAGTPGRALAAAELDLVRQRWEDPARPARGWVAWLQAELARRALVLGPSFDLAGARASAMRSTLDGVAGSASLTGAELNTLRILTEAADLAAATASQGGLAGFNTALGSVHQSLGGLGGGLTTFLDALGVKLPTALTTAAGKLSELAGGFGQLTANAPGVLTALGQLDGVLAALPIPLGAIGVALGFLALSTVTTAEKFNQSGAMIGASMDKAGASVVDSSKVMIRSLANVSAAADLTRAQLNWEKNGGIRPGNPAAFQRLFEDLDKAKRETTKFLDVFGSLTGSLKGSFGSAVSGALKGFLDGSKGMAEGLRTGIRDAVIGGIIDATLQKGLIEKSFGGLIERLAGELAKGDSWSLNSADKIIAEIGAKVPQVAKTLETVFGRLKGTLDKAFDPTAGILDARGRAYDDAAFQAGTLGTTDLAGALKAKVAADEKAIEALRGAGITSGGSFAGVLADLTKNRGALAEAIKEAAKPKTGSVPALAAGGVTSGPTMAMIGEGRFQEAVMPLSPATFDAFAASTVAALTSGSRSGGGWAAAAPAARGGDVTVIGNYSGKGRWSKQDADELGDMLVGRLARAGVRA
jgi:hypothetical protein